MHNYISGIQFQLELVHDEPMLAVITLASTLACYNKLCINNLTNEYMYYNTCSWK